MAIQNTRAFQDFILNQEISDEKGKDIQQMIGAFSEYIVAVNPEYVYNKTYLNAYVEEFIQCQKVLKLKYQILVKKILARIFVAGIEQECIINIDDAWIFEKEKIKLSNTFDPYIVKSHKMQLKLELVHENGFVVAEEICIDDNYENEINTCLKTFIERRKEVFADETE